MAKHRTLHVKNSDRWPSRLLFGTFWSRGPKFGKHSRLRLKNKVVEPGRAGKQFCKFGLAPARFSIPGRSTADIFLSLFTVQFTMVSDSSTRTAPVIVITGTPGTGKSTTAQLLAEESPVSLRHINISDWVKEKSLHEGYDQEWQSYTVDEDKVRMSQPAIHRGLPVLYAHNR